MPKPRDYEVGYGKPPEHGQFQKGQSGNPKGRPKGSRNVRKILEDTLLAPIPVNANGKRKKVPAIEAFIINVRNQALKGDLKAAQIFLRLLALLPGEPPANDPADLTTPASEDDLALYDALEAEVFKLFKDDLANGVAFTDAPADATPHGDGEDA